jgi:hypothetical protein
LFFKTFGVAPVRDLEDSTVTVPDDSEAGDEMRQVLFLASFLISSLVLLLFQDVSSGSRHRETANYASRQSKVDVVVPSAAFFDSFPSSAADAM